MANSLNIEQIKEILPHRSPFLLIDRIEDFEPGQYAIGKKCVSFNEPFFAGHFPQMAIMPGVLIVEALAQTGAVAILCKDVNIVFTVSADVDELPTKVRAYIK